MYNEQFPAIRRDDGRADGWHPSPWIAFNRDLDRAVDALPDEAHLAGWLDALDALHIDDPRVYWLTVARIAELALKLTGDYADCGEFEAAGDLLVNPRVVDVYLRGRARPVVKQRHAALSQQFARAIGDANAVAWLCRETLAHVRQPALLPHLSALLASSGVMTPAYLSDLNQRMAHAANTIAVLAAWQVQADTDLARRMQTASSADREMIEKSRCRFKLDDFHTMGADIAGIARGADRSRFLVPLRMASAG